MSGLGFVVWGLFLAFALIVAGYVVWMLRADRAEEAAAARAEKTTTDPAKDLSSPSGTESPSNTPEAPPAAGRSSP